MPGRGRNRTMADKRRFELFAHLLVQRFGGPRRVFDVAGGMGKLNAALTKLGCEVTTFDLRHKRDASVRYEQRLFTLDEPCTAQLVVGMHPDGATSLIIAYAQRHRIPFAIVPCCSENGMPYNPWMRHLVALAREQGFEVEEVKLEMAGRARVILGVPRAG